MIIMIIQHNTTPNHHPVHWHPKYHHHHHHHHPNYGRVWQNFNQSYGYWMKIDILNILGISIVTIKLMPPKRTCPYFVVCWQVPTLIRPSNIMMMIIPIVCHCPVVDWSIKHTIRSMSMRKLPIPWTKYPIPFNIGISPEHIYGRKKFYRTRGLLYWKGMMLVPVWNGPWSVTVSYSCHRTSRTVVGWWKNY